MNKEERRKFFYLKNLEKTGLPIKNITTIHTPSMVTEYVFAPLLVCYTIWILKEASKKEIRKIYYLARDGYPIYIIAQTLCKIYDIPIENRYFFCSRYSLRTPMYSEDIESAIDYICRGGLDLTLKKLIFRTGLDSDKQKIVKDLFPDKKESDYIPYADLKVYKDILKNSKEFIELLKKISEDKWPQLEAYFQQEGIFDENKIGIVDSGWTGTTQKSFNEICRRHGSKVEIIGFYFGLFEIPKEGNSNLYHGFYFDKKKGLFNKTFFSNCLFEGLFHANHGTTKGYFVEKAVYPILEDYEKDLLIEMILNIIDEYLENIEQYLSKERFMSFDVDMSRRWISKSVRRFMWSPTKNESELFGKIRFSDDLLDDHAVEIGRKMTNEELFGNHVLNKILSSYGLKKSYICESAWYECSAVRNGNFSIWHRCSYSIYKILNYIRKSF